MLALYRAALHLRRDLPNEFAWHETNTDDVIAFSRGEHFRCLVNLGDEPLQLDGEVLLASAALVGDRLPTDAAVWLTTK
ncbi:DUF3459 domain-containing protein [Kribbella sp. NPDC051620]|uniref:DUF3459 domain-containing protein n=1 Tax=Kribbella sp. NPDC051620 TaxID=3364120 RepID=UPI003797097E